MFAKPSKDAGSRVKYSFKDSLDTSEIGVTEHIEADACKFAVWLYRNSAPSTDNKIILKVGGEVACGVASESCLWSCLRELLVELPERVACKVV